MSVGTNAAIRRVLALIVLLSGLWCSYPAHAENPCWWNTSLYSSTASGGHEDSKVVYGTNGALGSTPLPIHFCQAFVTNNAASTVWFMLFDSATLPANGTKAKLEMPMSQNQTINTNNYPLPIANGVTVACSSTEGTLTVTAASDCNFTVLIGH